MRTRSFIKKREENKNRESVCVRTFQCFSERHILIVIVCVKGNPLNKILCEVCFCRVLLSFRPYEILDALKHKKSSQVASPHQKTILGENLQKHA